MNREQLEELLNGKPIVIKTDSPRLSISHETLTWCEVIGCMIEAEMKEGQNFDAFMWETVLQRFLESYNIDFHLNVEVY